MAIHENLTRVRKPRLRTMGRSKAMVLAKVARRGETISICNLAGRMGSECLRGLFLGLECVRCRHWWVFLREDLAQFAPL